MYGRTQMVNTTYISLAKYCRIYDTKDIDKYIQYEEMMEDYANDETLKEYINKPVSENIAASVQDFPCYI